MAATKARSVFVVSFAAGLLASAAVLVSSEGAAQPQPYFGLPNVDLVDEPPRPSETSQPHSEGHLKQMTSRHAESRSPLKLAVTTDDSAMSGATILLVNAQEPANARGRTADAPLPARRVSRVAVEVEDRNWSEVPPADRDRGAWMNLRPEAPRPGALRDWVRDRLRQSGTTAEETAAAFATVQPPEQSPTMEAWVDPVSLREQLVDHAAEGREEWTAALLTGIQAAVMTGGPADPATRTAIDALAELAVYGMQSADEDHDLTRAAHTRRAALAMARRLALWDAAADICCGGREGPVDSTDAGGAEDDLRVFLAQVERFEAVPTITNANDTRLMMEQLAVRNVAGMDKLAQAFHDHYLAPNVRIAATTAFADRLMPDPAIERGPVAETILGRDVRGNRVVKTTTRIVFVPDPHDVRLDIEVQGDVFSRTVTDAGPVSLNSNSTSRFTVRKPVKLGSEGLLVGDARAVASNRSKVSGMQTSFDNIPLMGSLVRSIARNQQESALPEANREAARKVIQQACRDTDAQTEPQLADLEQRVTEKLWQPLVGLGLDPVAMAMQTTEEMATVRLRLAGDGQLAGHTPRPRVPSSAELSVQVHDTCLNNAFHQLEIAGRVFPLDELYLHIGERLGMEVTLPDDLPSGVVIGFEEYEPIQVECRDGLVHVTVRIDSIESGRRDWYDVEAGVSYRLVAQDPQVVLEREGPVRIGGEGHRGRFEIGLRTVFGKIFPKERPIPLLPEKLASDPRLQDLTVSQAVVTDGWLAIALAPAVAETPATVQAPADSTVR
jgi:hypothetical protein